jgi:hypothetical protein
MKKIRLMGCMLVTMIGSGQLMAATVTQREWQEAQVIHLADLEQQVIQDFSQGKMRGTIVECPEGACLPLTMTIKGQFLALESAATAPMILRVLQSCYVRCDMPEHFLFSIDQQEWKEFSEFFTGSIKVSVDAQNGEVVAEVELELNQRKS